jgi:tetratricopeptide (TPR) repeat protein
MTKARWILVAALAFAPALVAAGESESKLGEFHFKNSGSPEAQEQFHRGVGGLYNFWFDEAQEAFHKAQQVDPDFALAYWGEAMSYNHPLWAEQDIAAARAVLQRFGKTRHERLEKTPTERERMYMEAVEILYGEGDKLQRDIAYEKAMGRIQERYPDDVEAAVFHALSILGTVRPGDEGFARQVKAGAIVLQVFKDHPNHPGAAHFIIHSFDDPVHAPLALPAAERYAEIAPEADHALHMPSHIFLQHGMWDRVAQSNLESYDASAKWVERKHLSVAKRSYHALEWRAYANLQRGVWKEVQSAIDIVAAAAKETQDQRVTYFYLPIMTARLFVATGKDDGRPLPEVTVGEGGRYNANADMLLALGLVAAQSGNVDRANEAASRLDALNKALAEKGSDYRANSVSIMAHELHGAVVMAQGDTDGALKQVAAAADLELKQDPPSGPVSPIKPAHELYGELLAKAGKHEQAIAAFETSLSRTPNRTQSLLGLARSSKAIGDMETARKSYATLRKYLEDADPDVPFLQEVRGFEASTDSAADN